MSDGAPVCQLPNLGQTPPSQPGRIFPSLVKAQDLPSAIAAINNLIQIVNFLTAPSLPVLGTGGNNLTINLPGRQLGFPTFLGNTVTGQKGGINTPRLVETNRTTETVKVENPDDSSNFVIVKRINSLTFTDRVTGSTLKWSRDKGSG